MSKVTDVFRITITTDQIFALVNAMTCMRNGIACDFDPVLEELYDKVDNQAYKIGKGKAKPAYKATGVRKESAVNLNSLGATPAETVRAKRDFDDMSEEAIFAELDRQNAKMLKEMGIDIEVPAVTSAVSEVIEDIILGIGEDSHPTDNDNMYAAFKNRES